MKTIWIVNCYTVPPEHCTHPRHLEFAKYLQMQGYDVTIFCSSYMRGPNVNIVTPRKLYTEAVYDGLKFVHIKTSKFEGNGIARILSIIQFAWRLFLCKHKFDKPDYILYNTHLPFDYPILWCARKLKSKFIVESWDKWPDDFVTRGLIKENNPLMKVSYWLTKRMYEAADSIIFSFEGGYEYLRSHGWTEDDGGIISKKQVFYINNGVDLSKFDIDKTQCKRDDSDLNNPNTIKIIYIGSIRLANDVKQLIDAASMLTHRSNIKFLIYGDGNDRELLVKYCIENNINNVIFKEKRIPFNEVAYVASQATINVMNYAKNAGKYGMSAGKMFQYFAAGKPILCNVKLGYSDIRRYNLGIDRDLTTPQDYADAILELLSMTDEEYNEMCVRVRSVAHKFDYKVLSKQLLTIIEGL